MKLNILINKYSLIPILIFNQFSYLYSYQTSYKMPDNIKATEIYSGSLWKVELLKSLLENADIGVYLKDEIIGNKFPFQASAGGNSPVKVIVSSKDYEQAMIVVQEFMNTMN